MSRSAVRIRVSTGEPTRNSAGRSGDARRHTQSRPTSSSALTSIRLRKTKSSAVAARLSAKPLPENTVSFPVISVAPSKSPSTLPEANPISGSSTAVVHQAPEGLARRVPLNAASRRRLWGESGPSIVEQKKDVRWRAARDNLQEIKHKLQSLLLLRTGADRMAEFVDFVVNRKNSKRVTTSDPIDDRYTLHRIPIGRKTASLSVGPGTAGTLRVHAFARELDLDIGLQQTLNELKADDWDIRYGTEWPGDDDPKRLTIDPSQPRAVAQALRNDLASVELTATGRPPAPVVAETAHRYFLANDRTGTYAQFLKDNRYLLELDRGIYAGTIGRLQNPLDMMFPFDSAEAPEGVTLHDAAMAAMSRNMFAPLNRALRDGNPPKVVTDLVVEIEAALSKFPRFQGTVVRTIGNRSFAGPESPSLISSYTVGQKRTWPAFSYCIRKDSPSKPLEAGNLRFVIDVTEGRDIGCISKWRDIMLPTRTRVKVLASHVAEDGIAEVHLEQIGAESP
jgi:hypothetical protein